MSNKEPNRELVEKTRELGFNLSKTLENQLINYKLLQRLNSF